MLQFKVNYVLSHKTQLMNPLNLLMKVSIVQSTQYKTCKAFILFLFLKDSESTC